MTEDSAGALGHQPIELLEHSDVERTTSPELALEDIGAHTMAFSRQVHDSL